MNAQKLTPEDKLIIGFFLANESKAEKFRIVKNTDIASAKFALLFDSVHSEKEYKFGQTKYTFFPFHKGKATLDGFIKVSKDGTFETYIPNLDTYEEICYLIELGRK